MDPAEIADRLGARLEHHEGRSRWWVSTSSPAVDASLHAAVQAMGLEQTRQMYQLRRPLPLEYDLATSVASIAVRAFRPGTDDDAWLAVNNAAFRHHPDQGGWTRAQLCERMAEPWFDPEGFLVSQSDGHIAGFCWTKVHATDPPMGEIFVIGTDPTHQGRGLGASLAVAGLEWLWTHRHTPIAMLYVEADNDPALRLYRRLGFVIHHRDFCFEAT